MQMGGLGAVGGVGISDAKYTAKISELSKQVTELNIALESADREREFYFSKLRQIEVLIHERLNEGVESDHEEDMYKQIQNILYSTEVPVRICFLVLWCLISLL